MSKYYQSAYGKWAWNPEGQKPDFSKCAADVYPKGAYISKQCGRARGHGPEQSFCKTHSKRFDKEALE